MTEALYVSGGLGALLTVVGLFVRSILAAAKVTNEQHDEWRRISEQKESTIKQLRTSVMERDRTIRDLQQQLYGRDIPGRPLPGDPDA